MQDHEMRGLLGPAYDDTTEEQRAMIDEACAMIAARWPAGDPSYTDALSAMLQVALGDATDVQFADRWHAVRKLEREAHAQLTGAIVAASLLGGSELALSERLGVSRPTLRKALGKG